MTFKNVTKKNLRPIECCVSNYIKAIIIPICQNGITSLLDLSYFIPPKLWFQIIFLGCCPRFILSVTLDKFTWPMKVVAAILLFALFSSPQARHLDYTDNSYFRTKGKKCFRHTFSVLQIGLYRSTPVI